LPNNSSPSDQENLKYNSLDLSWWDESSGDSFAFLHMIYGEILNKTVFSFIFTVLFYVLLYILPFIMHKNVKLPLFNSFHQDKSNELCFKFFLITGWQVIWQNVKLCSIQKWKMLYWYFNTYISIFIYINLQFNILPNILAFSNHRKII
jgi:hypothetical protein